MSEGHAREAHRGHGPLLQVSCCHWPPRRQFALVIQEPDGTWG